jgi:hypothetical protein
MSPTAPGKGNAAHAVFAGMLLLLTVGANAGAQERHAREARAQEPYLIGPAVLQVAPPESTAAQFRDLAAAVEAASEMAGGATIHLEPGDYHLTPNAYTDPTCGNCEDPNQPVAATLGLRISGDRITLQGDDPDLVRIHTHAGYGLLFEDCTDCRIEGVTVTGGERDTSGNATDAAIVARRTTLTISRCRIADNTGDSATVAQTIVGVMGICGREDAEIIVTDCEILRNSWDGIALYRDAHARIENCVIDGVDGGSQGPACGGRGVAIGITWNARAEVTGNLIRRYWKGIGIFVDAEARVRENVIEEMLTWGITLWDADRGKPYAEIEWNAIHRTGACGIAVTRALEGGRTGSRIVYNALARTGRNSRYDSDDTYCYQRALAIHATRPDIEISRNLFFDNREPGDVPGSQDMAEPSFREALHPLFERLAARPVLRGSDFLREFLVE